MPHPCLVLVGWVQGWLKWLEGRDRLASSGVKEGSVLGWESQDLPNRSLPRPPPPQWMLAPRPQPPAPHDAQPWEQPGWWLWFWI